MTGRNDIDDALGMLADVLITEHEGGTTDPKETLGPLVVLVGGALINLERIADAVEKLAKFEYIQIGEIAYGGDPVNNPFGEQAKAYGSLTADEVETIEALRRGDITVVMAKQEAPWTGWHGVGIPNVEPYVLVDVRFRKPTAGGRVPDLIGVQAATVNWQNTGRPSNADVVAYRISDKQAADNN